MRKEQYWRRLSITKFMYKIVKENSIKDKKWRSIIIYYNVLKENGPYRHIHLNILCPVGELVEKD